MYTLLIVDDEEIVRRGMRRYINWEQYDITTIYDAASAEDAIEIIKKCEVDIVLTDIVMPDMSGLEMITHIKEINSELIIIVISGFGEFEYAQDALRKGVFDYITKPVNFEAFHPIMLKVREKLDDKYTKSNEFEMVQKILREQLFLNLLNGSLANEEEVIYKAQNLGLDINLKNACIIRCLVSDRDDNVKDELEKLLSEEFSLCLSTRNGGGREVIFLLNELPEKEELSAKLNLVLENINQKYKCRFYIGVGEIYSSIMNTHKCYIEAGKALEYVNLKKTNSVIFYQDIIRFFKGNVIVDDTVRTEILRYLVTDNGSMLWNYIESIFEKIKENEYVNINIIYDACVEIILIVKKYVSSTVGIQSVSFIENDVTIKNLIKLDETEDIIDFMHGFIEQVVALINQNSEKSSIKIIKDAQKYICEHYGEQINLQIIADYLYVNPVYLSKLFKEKTGEKFVDYVTRIRIEESKKLLKDNCLKIYHISEMVGFNNPKYFSKVFKNITDLSPNEYRNKIIG